MLGMAGAHSNRPKLVAIQGYDSKFAMHALRFGVQGIELLTTGRLTLPVHEPDREYLRSVRRGEVPKDEVISAIEASEAKSELLRTTGVVPHQPDRDWVDGWLHRSYQRYWATLKQ